MKICLTIFFMIWSMIACAQITNTREALTVCFQNNSYTVPISSIDSLFFPNPESNVISIQLLEDSVPKTFMCDSIKFASITDTLYLKYNENNVIVHNPRLDSIDVCVDDTAANVTVTAHHLQDLVICISGESSNGSLRVVADTTYTLCMNGITLKSRYAPAFDSGNDTKLKVDLADNTDNIFEDGDAYSADNTANGCFNSKGHIDFVGNGSLTIKGNRKHALYCKKGVRFKSGTVNIASAPSDAVHSGKYISIEGGMLYLNGMQQDGMDMDEYFAMTKGRVEINIQGDGCKGIKCAESMNISGGTIYAVSQGDIVNDAGDLKYCTLLKSDKDICISDSANLQLINNSAGGKCLSCDGNMNITGGNIYAETNGDGAEYINSNGEIDYYTAKCIAVNNTLNIICGTIACLSTGLGGKGFVVDEMLQIGTTDFICGQPIINVETKGECIINNVDEDLRFGCPKAIKAGELLCVYGGDIHCTTHGMGGEGIESKGEMYVYGGNIECNTFDDGINVEGKIDIWDGTIYCNSIDNDGIDSNGKITLLGGTIVAINQNEPNESFDSENEKLYLYGSTVIGIGCRMVHVAESEYPCYNTRHIMLPDGTMNSGIELLEGKYLYIVKDESVICSLLNPTNTKNGFITTTMRSYLENGEYSLYIGDKPLEYDTSLFGNKLYLGGKLNNARYIIDFRTNKINN